MQWATERVLRRILPDEAVEWIDPSAKVALVERQAPAPAVGHKLADLDVEGLARVVALSRLGVSQLPSPSLVLQEGDVVYLAVAGDRIDDLDTQLAAVGSHGAHGAHGKGH